MSESKCNHVTLKRKIVGGQHWYQCECGQKFKVVPWDGKVTVLNEAAPVSPHKVSLTDWSNLRPDGTRHREVPRLVNGTVATPEEIEAKLAADAPPLGYCDYSAIHKDTPHYLEDACVNHTAGEAGTVDATPEPLEVDVKVCREGMPELDSSDDSRSLPGARNLLGNSLKQKLSSLRDLARWDGPDAAPKRMHEIWTKLVRIIENDDWAAQSLPSPALQKGKQMNAQEFYEANATNVVNVSSDPAKSGWAGVRRASEARFIAKDALVMTIQDAWDFAEKYLAVSLAFQDDLELISAKVHQQWMESKRLQGVSSRKSESAEELMVPYAELSEVAKELDRGSVRAVLSARAASPAQPVGSAEKEH